MDSNKSTEKEDPKPFDQYTPFAYSRTAFCEWFRRSSRSQRGTAVYVLLHGFLRYRVGIVQNDGPLAGQYVFLPSRDKVSDGTAASLVAVLLAGLYGSVFLFCAIKTGLQPSAEAIVRWSAETALGSLYTLLAAMGTICAGIVFIAVCAMVWVPLCPLGHLTVDGWYALLRRAHLALKGTATFTFIHFLLPSVVNLLPFSSSFLYALPSVAVGMDWWLEDLIRRAGRGGNGEEVRVVQNVSTSTASASSGTTAEK